MGIDAIITNLEARAEELVEEHGRIERALSELRPEHRAEPPSTRTKRKRLAYEDVRERVRAALQGQPDESFSIEQLATLVDYNDKTVARAVRELADAGSARIAPSTATGWPSRFPRYQYTPPLAAQLATAKERA